MTAKIRHFATMRARPVGIASLALGIAVIGAATAGIDDPLVSMAVYTSALMSLNQLAPPLLLLGLPPSWRAKARHSLLGVWLLDPWVAISVFIALTTVVSLPQVFDRSLANAVYAAPLGIVELIAGTILWFQFFPAGSSRVPTWRQGLLGWLAGLPMMAVGIVWIWSDHVLYAPYLDVICEWNVTPLQDQRWAGMLMILFGLPLQVLSAWLISGILFDAN